jgi:cytochrome c oxidase cbb3-type subunit 3
VEVLSSTKKLRELHLMKENFVKENKILNEKEKALLLDHNYDGIQEFDYPLPSWWTWTFIGGVAFALFYILFYEFAGAPSLKDEYNIEITNLEQIKIIAREKRGGFELEEYNSWIMNNDGVAKGAKVFEENCLSCHAEGGKGDIGPNLTDNHWLNIKSVTPESLVGIITKGVEDNGMPAWGEILTKEEIMEAAAFVLTLKNTNAPEGKAPQGEIISE